MNNLNKKRCYIHIKKGLCPFLIWELSFQKSWPCFFVLIKTKTIIQSKSKVAASPKEVGEAKATHSRLNIIRKIITTNQLCFLKNRAVLNRAASPVIPKNASKKKILLETGLLDSLSAAKQRNTDDAAAQLKKQQQLLKNIFVLQRQHTLYKTQTRKIFLNKIYNQFSFGKQLQSRLFSHNVNKSYLAEEWNQFYEKFKPVEAKQSVLTLQINDEGEGFVYKNSDAPTPPLGGVLKNQRGVLGRLKKITNKSYMQLPQGKLLSSRYFKNKKVTYSKILEISLITISLASANRIRQWAEKTLPNGKVVGEVLNPETVHYKTLKPIKGGLFCERIFGPLKDHECACGKKFNIKHYLAKLTSSTSQRDGAAFLNFSQQQRQVPASDPKLTLGDDDKVYKKRYFCRVCDVEYTYSIIRRTQLGYIKLASPTTHVWFVKGSPSYISILLDMKKTHLQNVIYNTETLTLEHALKSSNKNDMPLTPSSIFESWQKIMLLRKNSPQVSIEKQRAVKQPYLTNSQIQLQSKNKDSDQIKKATIVSSNQDNYLAPFIFLPIELSGTPSEGGGVAASGPGQHFPNTVLSTQKTLATESIIAMPINIIKQLKTNFNGNLDKNEEFLLTQKTKPARSTRLGFAALPADAAEQRLKRRAFFLYGSCRTSLAQQETFTGTLSKFKSSKKDFLNLKISTNNLIYLSNLADFAQESTKISVYNSQENYNASNFLKEHYTNNKPRLEKAQSQLTPLRFSGEQPSAVLFKAKSLNRAETGFFLNIYKQNKKTFYSLKNNKNIENGWGALVTLPSSCKEVINTKLSRGQRARHYVNRYVARLKKKAAKQAYGLKFRDFQNLKYQAFDPSIWHEMLHHKLLKVNIIASQKKELLINYKTQNKNFALEPAAHFETPQQQDSSHIKQKVKKGPFFRMGAELDPADVTSVNFSFFFKASTPIVNRAWLAIFNSLIPYGLKKKAAKPKMFYSTQLATNSAALFAKTGQFENIQNYNYFSKHPAKNLKKIDKDLKNIACFVKSNWKFKTISVFRGPASQQLSKQLQSALIKYNTASKLTFMPLTRPFQSNRIFQLTKKSCLLLWNILKYSLEKLWLLSGCFSSFSNTIILKSSLNPKKAFKIVCLLTSFLKVNNFNFFEKQTTKLTLMLLLNLTNEIPTKPQRVALSKRISKNKKKASASMDPFKKYALRDWIKKESSPVFEKKGQLCAAEPFTTTRASSQEYLITQSQTQKFEEIKTGDIKKQIKKIQNVIKFNANLKIKLAQRLNTCFMYYLTQNLKKIKDQFDSSSQARPVLKKARHTNASGIPKAVPNQSVQFFLFAAKQQERKRFFKKKLKKIQKTIRVCFLLNCPLQQQGQDSLKFSPNQYNNLAPFIFLGTPSEGGGVPALKVFYKEEKFNSQRRQNNLLCAAEPFLNMGAVLPLPLLKKGSGSGRFLHSRLFWFQKKTKEAPLSLFPEGKQSREAEVNKLNLIYKKLRRVYGFSLVPTILQNNNIVVLKPRTKIRAAAGLLTKGSKLLGTKPRLGFLFKNKISKYDQNLKNFSGKAASITENKNQAFQTVNYLSFLKTSKQLTLYFFFLNQSEKQRIYKLYDSLILRFETTQNKIIKYLFLLKAFFYNKNIINKKTTNIKWNASLRRALFPFKKNIQPNPKLDLSMKLQAEQINKKLGQLPSQARESLLVNNLYCISHRELWEQEKNWQDFAFYYYDYSQNLFKGVDISIPNYKHRNYDIFFTPLLISNQDNTIYEKNSKAFTKLFNNGMNINTSFSGAGLIQKLLNEYDFNELKRIDKQNRIVLFEYNKYIKNLKKNIVPRRPKKSKRPREAGAQIDFLRAAKEVSPKAKSKQIYYKACHIRDVLIRRTKLTRKILIFFESNPKVNTDTEKTPACMILTFLPVLPPVLRPVLKMAGQFTISDLNRLYQRIIYRNERLKKFLKDPALNSSFEMKYAQRLLQEAVDNLIQNGKSGVVSEKDTRGRLLKSLSDILKGKHGRFRQYLLGKRVDYSGRSVIVVGPQLKLYECGIPKEMALVLYSPFLIKRILNEKLADTYLSAKKLIKTNPLLVSQLLREIMKSCPVLLNRAPTLHRLGFQAFQPKLIDGKAILLHPLVCPAFNADFDGDQMAVHVPITFEARAEAWKLMLARTNLLSPATGDPLILPSQDMVLGCYYLTTNSTGFQKIYSSNGCSALKKKFTMGAEKVSYFNNITDVLKAYSQKLINLHTIIWVNINANIENGHLFEQPLEIRVPLTRYKLSKHQKIRRKEDQKEAGSKQLTGSLLKQEQKNGNEIKIKPLFKENNQAFVMKKAFYYLNYLEIYPKLHNFVNWTSLNKKPTHVGKFLKDESIVKTSSFECEQEHETRIKQIIRTTPGKILFNVMIKNAMEKQPSRFRHLN